MQLKLFKTAVDKQLKTMITIFQDRAEETKTFIAELEDTRNT
jgi:hypothetical protein